MAQAHSWDVHSLLCLCLQHISLENSNHISLGYSNLPQNPPLVFFVNDSNLGKTHLQVFRQVVYIGNGDMR